MPSRRKAPETTGPLNVGRYDYQQHLSPDQKERATANFRLQEADIETLRQAINRKGRPQLTWHEVCTSLSYQGMDSSFTFAQVAHFLSTAFNHPPEVQKRTRSGVACAWHGQDILHLAQNTGSPIHLWFEVRTEHAAPVTQAMF